jgi:hypothetical protein
MIGDRPTSEYSPANHGDISFNIPSTISRTARNG